MAGVEIGWTDLIVTPFRKATGSTANDGDCVEVADLADGGWLVRDSKDRGGPNVRVTAADRQAFLGLVKAGGFDVIV